MAGRPMSTDPFTPRPADLGAVAGGAVHRWAVSKAYGSEGWRQSRHTVGHLMSTDLFTVRPDDLVEMVARVMEWRDVRHVPVEDEEGGVGGIVTHRSLH